MNKTQKIIIILILLLLPLNVTGINITTNNATNVGTNYATLNGNLTELIDSSATVWFEYGMVSNVYIYGTEEQTLASNGTFTQDIEGPNLIPGDIYYFRAVGNASGDVSGNDTIAYGEPESNVTFSLTPIPTQNFSQNYEELKAAKFNLTKLAIVVPKTYTDMFAGTRENALGLFVGILFALIFLSIWLRQEDVGVPALLGMLIGGGLWAFLPSEFIKVAYSILVVSLGCLIYSLIKGRK